MNKRVIINTQFTATHNWTDCNIPEVEYLYHRHRHVFHVTMKWNILYNDRDIEFIFQKEKVDKYLRDNFEGKFLAGVSCEDIAETLLNDWKACFVSILEDGENGAELSI